MWRDIFLGNSALVLETLEKYQSDLGALIRAIREEDGDALTDALARSRDIRSRIIEAGQHQMETEKTE